VRALRVGQRLRFALQDLNDGFDRRADSGGSSISRLSSTRVGIGRNRQRKIGR
jgi:hypothetical protein